MRGNRRIGKSSFQSETTDQGITRLPLNFPREGQFPLKSGKTRVQLSVGEDCLLLVVRHFPDAGFANLKRVTGPVPDGLSSTGSDVPRERKRSVVASGTGIGALDAPGWWAAGSGARLAVDDVGIVGIKEGQGRGAKRLTPLWEQNSRRGRGNLLEQGSNQCGKGPLLPAGETTLAQPNSPRGKWWPRGTRLYGNRPKGGKVQWGVWGAHAFRQGKPGLAHQQSKLNVGVD
jgi:hypothetical protein